MLKKLSSIILMGLCGLIISTSNLYAEENKEHSPIGTRPLTEEQKNAAMEIREREAKELGEESSQPSGKIAASTYVLSPYVYHYIYSHSVLFGTVTLEDGSVWSCSTSSAITASTWFSTDILVLTLNSSWFSFYDYQITNQNTGETIKVNLKSGPYIGSQYTRSIAAIDYMNFIIWLNDGTQWLMDPYESYTTDLWLVGDTVMLGVNYGLYSFTYPNILINLNTLTNARAGLFY